MLESVKKLRGVATDFGMPLIYLLQDAYDSDTATGALLIACDEINREISEHYIERDKVIEAPVDADGIVWKNGDTSFLDEKGFEHPLTSIKINLVSGVCMIRSKHAWHLASKCRHVKARTVEDVLSEYSNEFEQLLHALECAFIDAEKYKQGLIDINIKYANELRDLLGGEE